MLGSGSNRKAYSAALRHRPIKPSTINPSAIIWQRVESGLVNQGLVNSGTHTKAKSCVPNVCLTSSIGVYHWHSLCPPVIYFSDQWHTKTQRPAKEIDSSAAYDSISSRSVSVLLVCHHIILY